MGTMPTPEPQPDERGIDATKAAQGTRAAAPIGFPAEGCRGVAPDKA